MLFERMSLWASVSGRSLVSLRGRDTYKLLENLTTKITMNEDLEGYCHFLSPPGEER
jgi:hypothetical protein